ncbi:MAG: TRAP transporter fused permease subunit [Hyphomicrobiales bacterium]|nr:TRAP transporter fused permease subunit [Hyphomicrobiales bacterium]
MAEAKAQRLEYNEVRDYSFLDNLLRARGSRGLAYWVMAACAVIGLGLALYHLFVAVYGTPEGRAFRSVHLTGMMIMAVLIKPLFRESSKDPLLIAGDRRNALRVLGFSVDLGVILLIVAVQIYTLWDISAFEMRLGDKDPDDLLAGTILIVLVLDATRRVVGWSMVCVAVFFIVHSLYAHYFPGFFYGPPTRPGKFVETIFMETNGIFGIPLHVSATYIVLFIIFGGVLLRSGAGRFFVDLAVSLTGHRTGGPAKAATVASAFTGTVYGSAVANVVTTGSFTIPLMKNLGYRARFAAAVEACASSGGQITPPVMGAAAFIMAEFLEMPYAAVIAAAAIPAFIYFATIYFMVQFEAEKHGIERIDKSRLPVIWDVLKEGWHLLLSLVVLVGLLAFGYTPMSAGFWSILAVIGLSFVSRHTRMSPVDILSAIESGIKAAMPVAIACACAGIIVGSVFVSGLGLKFTQAVIELSGGQLFPLLVLTALAAIVLGMGMTTTAVYITVAALIVPSLIHIGVVPMAAHMFAFYFGVVSTITPPVALAAFAGAAIAGTPPMSTAVEASKVGVAKYLVPFAFVYNPALLLEGPWWLSAYSLVAVLVAYWILSAALEGWLHGRLPLVLRLACFAAAVCLMVPPQLAPYGVPGFAFNAAGLVLTGVLIMARRRALIAPAAG